MSPWKTNSLKGDVAPVMSDNELAQDKKALAVSIHTVFATDIVTIDLEVMSFNVLRASGDATTEQ
jgi:hypothetical protein